MFCLASVRPKGDPWCRRARTCAAPVAGTVAQSRIIDTIAGTTAQRRCFALSGTWIPIKTFLSRFGLCWLNAYSSRNGPHGTVRSMPGPAPSCSQAQSGDRNPEAARQQTKKEISRALMPVLDCTTLPPPARSHLGTYHRDDRMADNPMAEHHRGSLPWELSELPVLKEKFASAGAFRTAAGAKTSEIPWRREPLPRRTAGPPRCVDPGPTKRRGAP